VTYEPGIDEGKIDRLTLRLSLCAFQGARTYDACLEFRCVCDICEKGEVHRRGEVWISKAFHLANLPTISLTSRLPSHRWLYAAFLLLATYRLSRICSPSEERRTQISGFRQFQQDYREGLLASALMSDPFLRLM